ncbi:MAG TPA: hypothetical protein VHU77_11035, partial [Candidatus Limnocylindria bacterium]|nr:hypothetical protein [Candidatus Limnocylindria bacterium]
VVSYSVRFRGRGYPNQRIFLGRSDEGMNRAGAEHEARLIATQILAGTWMPPLKADYVDTIGAVRALSEEAGGAVSSRMERDSRSATAAFSLNGPALSRGSGAVVRPVVATCGGRVACSRWVRLAHFSFGARGLAERSWELSRLLNSTQGRQAARKQLELAETRA